MLARKKGKHIECIGCTWAVEYIYDERTCCELRRVWPNGDIGAGKPDASGWGEDEREAMADAVWALTAKAAVGKI